MIIFSCHSFHIHSSKNSWVQLHLYIINTQSSSLYMKFRICAVAWYAICWLFLNPSFYLKCIFCTYICLIPSWNKSNVLTLYIHTQCWMSFPPPYRVAFEGLHQWVTGGDWLVLPGDVPGCSHTDPPDDKAGPQEYRWVQNKDARSMDEPRRRTNVVKNSCCTPRNEENSSGWANCL